MDALLSDLDPGTDGFADSGATSWLVDLSPRSDWSPLNSTSRLDQSELLNEQIHADELQDLLARLAATDAMFSEAVPTIRDVAEATDASPLLIGRILSQMRGPDEVVMLRLEMQQFAQRLEVIETALQAPAPPTAPATVLEEQSLEETPPDLPTEAPILSEQNLPLKEVGAVEWEKLKWTEIQQVEDKAWDELPKWDFLITNPETGERSQDARQVVTYLLLSVVFIVVALGLLPRCQDTRIESEPRSIFGSAFDAAERSKPK